jgi:transcription antitermination factor NusG
MHPQTNRRESQDPVMAFGWYAVYTRHQHEKAASEALRSKGIDVLLPLYRTVHRWKDRSKVVQLPLFPGYLFLQANLDRRLEILKTPGVCWIVSNGGSPCPISAREMEGVRALATNPDNSQPHPFLTSGDRVRVRSGHFAGVEGVLVRLKNHFRVVISVQLLQQSAAIEVGMEFVERIEGSRPAVSDAQGKPSSQELPV